MACDAIPGTEINTSAYLPDAIEAMVMTGRLDDARPFIEALENNGRRFDRAWMLAVGARRMTDWPAHPAGHLDIRGAGGMPNGPVDDVHRR